MKKSASVAEPDYPGMVQAAGTDNTTVFQSFKLKAHTTQLGQMSNKALSDIHQVHQVSLP